LRTAAGKRKKKKRKNFTCPPLEERTILKLKWCNRWTQQEIAFCCPIAPSKKAISKIVETNTNISKTIIKIQVEGIGFLGNFDT